MAVIVETGGAAVGTDALEINTVDVSPADGRVLIASSGGPLAPDPSWGRYDLLSACRCFGFDWQRGRQSELDVTDTGTARVYFHDRDGTFADDSWVGKQIMLQLWDPVALQWQPVFRGHIDDIPSEPSPGAPTLTNRQLDCVDIFDYLAGVKMVVGEMGDPIPATAKITGSVFYEDNPVDLRLRALFADAGVASSMNVVFSGNVIVNETLYGPDDDILSALRDAADAEFPSGVANVYVDRFGRAVFHGRFAKFDPDTTANGANWQFTRWAAATREDVTAGRAQIREFSFNRPRTRIINSYVAWPRQDENGYEFKQSLVETLVRTDTTSVGAYGFRGQQEPALIIKRHKTNGNTGAQECGLFGDHYIANYSLPRKNVQRITFKSVHPDDPRAEDTWALMTRADISDIIHLYVDEANLNNAEFFIEGINGECRVGPPEYDFVTVTPNLSPGDYYGTDVFG